MGLEVVGDLSGNNIMINEQFAEGTSDGRLILNGTGITVSIQTTRPSNFFQANLDAGSSFEMAEEAFVNVLDVHLRGGSSASIGENTYAIGKLRLYSHERAQLRIGRDCLIGDDVLCMTSDMHSIINVGDGARVNPPGDIWLSERVWVGSEAVILKGTTIGAGSIVGIRSVVMGKFPVNCMLLGYPARLVRSGITWSEELRPYKSRDQPMETGIR